MARLSSLPKELIDYVFSFLVLFDHDVEVHYASRQGSKYKEVKAMMLINKHLGESAAATFYRQNTLLFSRPSNDLPLFLLLLRESSLSKIKSVKIRPALRHINHFEDGLRLLSCCNPLSSLELDLGSKFPRSHSGPLKGLRARHFSSKGPELEEFCKVITGNTEVRGPFANQTREWMTHRLRLYYTVPVSQNMSRGHTEYWHITADPDKMILSRSSTDIVTNRSRKPSYYWFEYWNWDVHDCAANSLVKSTGESDGTVDCDA
ncbi:hypothetical protein B0T10DRAFT_463256 [Thelonectria olida]|uniref:F-box domain-containing protein n=1 Tax=Thelonectria olida TaxID=1576542 RepID=A0A9P8VY98_9HYPO|nr:hypothetical protein B0T10DRAFT_463256 [Thelonectria olida]